MATKTRVAQQPQSDNGQSVWERQARQVYGELSNEDLRWATAHFEAALAAGKYGSQLALRRFVDTWSRKGGKR